MILTTAPMARSRVLGRVLSVAAAGAALLVTTPSQADEREACAAAADKGQQLRDEGKYQKSREQLLLCSRDACPGPIKHDCLEWLTQIGKLTPTIVVTAKKGGQDLTDVTVSVDGAVLTEHLDGKPVPVDPGEHVFRFEHGGDVEESRVVIAAGQKGRSIPVTFSAGAAAAPPATPPPPVTADTTSRGSLVPAFVVGGIGVVALGSFAFFGLTGKSDVSDLEACRPFCAESDVDKARTKLIIADISLGVGVVALGVATYMILTRPSIDTSMQTGIASLKVDVGPTRGGAAAALGGRF